MRAFFYVFTFCYTGLFLFMIVSWFEKNRPLAYFLMVLIVGVTAAAALQELKPQVAGQIVSSRSISSPPAKLQIRKPIALKSNIRDAKAGSAVNAPEGAPISR